MDKKSELIHFMGLIKETSAIHSVVMDKKLDKFDCTPTQLKTMIALNHFTMEKNTSVQKKLAEELNITEVAVTNLLGRMESKELIVKKQNKRDPRYNDVELTEKAKEILKETKEILDETDGEILSEVSTEELNVAFECIKKINDKLERMKRGQN